MVLGALAAACFAIATLVLLRLHVLPTNMSPVADAVSDYGTTSFHRQYRVMAVTLGAGAVLLVVGLGRDTNAGSLYWLWIYGVSRIAIAGFMIDRDPPPLTREGRIHMLLAAAAFTSIAFAASDVRWTGSPGALGPLGYAVVATAVGTLLTRVIVPWRSIFGLVERLLYVAFVAWLLTAAISLASR